MKRAHLIRTFALSALVGLSACAGGTLSVEQVNAVSLDGDRLVIGGQRMQYDNGYLVRSVPFLKMCRLDENDEVAECHQLDPELIEYAPAEPSVRRPPAEIPGLDGK